ncbi:NAD(P)/FAD-dependent oxidoreductase [Paraburkholderia aspalathi]|uniref:NAD(P)/FAD-dependent oxidoreductase n=1 Tax=Paraburkholderia aspalathi TaxID=1324617 RepID=UPI003CBED1D1
MQHFDYVVIGGGPAGGAAAIELARGADRPSVALIGEEPYAPYKRPPLSKTTLVERDEQREPSLLFGGVAELQLSGVTPFIPHRAARVDRGARVVQLESGEFLSYRKVLFATGSAPRRLPAPGAELEGIHYLRTYDDAIALSREFAPKRKVVVVGGGFIGLETGATARRAGCEVSVVEAAPRLLARGVPEVISHAVAHKFQLEGVRLVHGQSVRAFRGDGHVTAIELDDGTQLAADCVVIGIGVVPNTELAGAAGLEICDGILTDGRGQTADPSCFAAGDVACRVQGLSSHPTYMRRLEAWEPAIEQAVATAREMRGEAPAPAGTPWIWSDQFDWNLQIAGYGELADTTVVRACATPTQMIVFQLWRQRLIGAIALNDGRSMTLLRRAMERGEPLDADSLADPSVPLRQALATRPATDVRTNVQ